MTKLKEEKDLQAISDEYSKAIALYQKKNLKKAQEAFAKIIKDFENSEFYSVLEIQTRAKVYNSIIHSITNPVKIDLKTRDDYLWEGVYQLNSGNVEQAVEYLHKAHSGDSNPFVFYLLAIAHFQKQNLDKALEFLKKCIGIDPYYKIVAYNEPDLEALRENPDFLSLVE